MKLLGRRFEDDHRQFTVFPQITFKAQEKLHLFHEVSLTTKQIYSPSILIALYLHYQYYLYLCPQCELLKNKDLVSIFLTPELQHLDQHMAADWCWINVFGVVQNSSGLSPRPVEEKKQRMIVRKPC